jgi:nardilysin
VNCLATQQEGDDEEGSSSGSEGKEDEEGSEEEEPRGRKGTGGGGGAVKKAAAALSVGVGHFTDPWNLQGLSHYLEHMLFMGSEKYPDENDYDAFLTAHGGASNACTEEVGDGGDGMGWG